jgi:hypothetical protein
MAQSKRRRRTTCAQCGRDLPSEAGRDALTSGTDVCIRCASVKLNAAYKTAAARRWLEGWREKLRTSLQLQEPANR